MKKDRKIGIEAHGTKGMKNTKWRKIFKDVDSLNKWTDNNDAEVDGQRDVYLDTKEPVKENKLTLLIKRLIKEEVKKLNEDDYYDTPVEWKASKLTEYQVRDFESLINEKFPIQTIYPKAKSTNSWCIDYVEQFPPTKNNGMTQYFIRCTDDNTGKLSESFRSTNFTDNVDRDGNLSSHERPNEVVYEYEDE